jgi:dinuclear metal center YbgI/SA1388 family protein
MAAPTLAEVVDILHEIAPLELAAEWDNVGLVLQPRAMSTQVARVLLTVDLTEPVIREARQWRADLVVAYHPPVFAPLQRLRIDHPGERRVLAAIAAGFVVYSPHTALDAAPDGLADWLAAGVLGGEMPKDLGACGEGEYGRVVVLPRAVGWPAFLQRVRKHLGVRDLRVALPGGASGALGRAPRAVRRVAVAAGSGASVLRGVPADVWVTGELSHHDALAATAAGTAVITAGHSNTERGFLPVLRRRLLKEFTRGLGVRVARRDADPFVVA